MAFSLRRGGNTASQPTPTSSIPARQIDPYQGEVRPGRAVHLTRPGESMNSIAKKYGIPVSSIIKLNSHQIGSNGSGFAPGLRLEL